MLRNGVREGYILALNESYRLALGQDSLEMLHRLRWCSLSYFFSKDVVQTVFSNLADGAFDLVLGARILDCVDTLASLNQLAIEVPIYSILWIFRMQGIFPNW